MSGGPAEAVGTGPAAPPPGSAPPHAAFEGSPPASGAAAAEPGGSAWTPVAPPPGPAAARGPESAEPPSRTAAHGTLVVEAPKAAHRFESAISVASGLPTPAATASTGPATPGSTPLSPEFLYGGQGPRFALTAQQPARMSEPPPDPYRQLPPAAMPSPVATTPTTPAAMAVLTGEVGTFTLTEGDELRAGRDPARCQIALSEPRVSGCHATLRLDQGRLLIRDENSNNGTMVNGNRIKSGMWSTVPGGSLLRIGPVEFGVRLEQP